MELARSIGIPLVTLLADSLATMPLGASTTRRAAPPRRSAIARICNRSTCRSWRRTSSRGDRRAPTVGVFATGAGGAQRAQLAPDLRLGVEFCPDLRWIPSRRTRRGAGRHRATTRTGNGSASRSKPTCISRPESGILRRGRRRRSRAAPIAEPRCSKRASGSSRSGRQRRCHHRVGTLSVARTQHGLSSYQAARIALRRRTARSCRSTDPPPLTDRRLSPESFSWLPQHNRRRRAPPLPPATTAPGGRRGSPVSCSSPRCSASAGSQAGFTAARTRAPTTRRSTVTVPVLAKVSGYVTAVNVAENDACVPTPCWSGSTRYAVRLAQADADLAARAGGRGLAGQARRRWRMPPVSAPHSTREHRRGAGERREGGVRSRAHSRAATKQVV